ncbi:acyl-CoA N-acyltransferase [Cryomyces antarcticus]
MPLEIQPMTESDIPTFVAIFMAAFEGGISRILRTTPTPTPESIASNEERFLKALREDSTAHFAKCVDSDTGEVVAGAKWNFYSEGRTEAELQKALELPSEWPRGSNVPALEAFLGMLARARVDVMGGKRHALLHILATLPSHHRRGAGALLLREGLDRADNEGIEAYLEASKMGKPLYERFGFETVKELRIDTALYGGEGVDVHTCMIRQPQARETGGGG